jgi:hypothetical protein
MPYLKSHPFVFAFAIGAALSGLLVICVPSAQATSLTLTELPIVITLLWGAMLMVGGSFCGYGIWTRKTRFEGTGVMLLAATQLFAAVTSVAALGWGPSLLGVILRASLAAGLLARALILMRLPS